MVTASLKLLCEVLNAGATRIPNQLKGPRVTLDLVSVPLGGGGQLPIMVESLTVSTLSS